MKNFIFTLFISFLFVGFSFAQVEGCVDPKATNYNENATVQAKDQRGNSLCAYASCADVPEPGCMYDWTAGGHGMTNGIHGFKAFTDDFTEEDCSEYDPGHTPCKDLEDDEEFALKELEALGIKLYPNPVKDKFYLQAENPYEFLDVQVMSLTGTVLLEHKFRNIQSDELIEFSSEHLSSGIYLLNVSTQKESVTTSWIKE